MIYLAVFAITALLLYFAGKCHGALERVLAGAGLLIPCIMAGVRGLGIGTDVMVYGVWTFRSALGSDLLAFLDAYSGVSPLGFNLFSWLVSNASGSFEVYLGSLQLITILPIYSVAHYLFRRREWLCVLCYLFLLYPLSLNIMKQSIAVAIGFAAVVFAFEGKALWYLVLVLSACLFHETGFVAALSFPLLRIVSDPQLGYKLFGKWRALVLFLIGIVLAVAVFVFGEEIVRSLSIFKESYEYQALHIGAGGSNESALILAVFSAAVWWLCRGTVDNSSVRIITENPEREIPALAGYDFYFVAFAFSCVLMQLGLVAESLGRIGYYFLPFAGLFVSSLVYDTGKKGSYAAVMMVVLFAAYFVFAFMVRGGGEIYPFVTAGGDVFL